MKDGQSNTSGNHRDPARKHSFEVSPNATLLKLSLPVLLSLIAEPLTGVVDTAFIAHLGAVPLAALGVGTMVLSSMFWAFNFLGIGTQTEVARDLGGEQAARVRRMAALAVLMGLFFGVLLALVMWPLAPRLADLMGADGNMRTLAGDYIRARVFGAPAVLATIAAFGVFRGRQDMRTPLWIATGINTLNVLLDPLLIFGYGPIHGFGVAGAGWASVLSQWAGAVSLMLLIRRRIGRPDDLRVAEAVVLLQIGKDLFIRTGTLTLFLLLTTRAATQLGPPSGAAHQAIRQVWVLTALFLDAYAVTGQSLVAYFAGARQLRIALNVARVVCVWSVVTGMLLSLGMWLGQAVVIALLVPAGAVGPFMGAWLAALIAQPVNALAFATDGIHWGMGDFRFLRNVVLTATLSAAALLFALRGIDGFSLAWIWKIVAVWILIRAAAGVLRIWPGFGRCPIRRNGGQH
jgi:MATE family multidrug resistance protein